MTMKVLRNFTCQQWPSEEFGEDSLANITTPMPLINVSIELNEQYESLQSFLANTSYSFDGVGQSCQIYVDTCMFTTAQVCLFERFALWHIFLAYLPVAVILVLVALLFNTLSIFLVTRVRHKFPRHVLLINLSMSDMTLSLFTLIKRSSDFLPENDFKYALLSYGNMLWQALWLISAFTILFLACDCFLATRFVFIYDKRSTQLAVRSLVVVLWFSALLFTGLLLHFEMMYSLLVQYVICILMMAILLSIVAQSVYAFTLTERIRRQQVSTLRDDKSKKQARKSRVKSSSTIAILLTSSFISWLPLVVFFTVDEEYHAENAIVSNQLLAVCLVCFHINGIVNPIVYSLRFKDVRAPLRRQLAHSKLLKPLNRLVSRLDGDDDYTSSHASTVFPRGASGSLDQRRRETLAFGGDMSRNKLDTNRNCRSVSLSTEGDATLVSPNSNSRTLHTIAEDHSPRPTVVESSPEAEESAQHLLTNPSVDEAPLAKSEP